MEIEAEENYAEWIKKVEEDLISLESLLKHRDGAPATGCFLAQQATEKFLKALAVYKGLELEKIHDLIKIANTLESVLPEIKQFMERLANITRYYIETRYPGNYPEFTWEECYSAYKVADEVRIFVSAKISPKQNLL